MHRTFQAIRQRQEELLLLLALSFGLVLVIQPTFRLSFWQSLAIAVPIGIAIVVAFSWFLASRRRERNRPLATEMHPDLGEVRLFADRWEAVVSGPPFPERVELTGDSTTPSAQQLVLFRSIRERYETLVNAAMDELADELKMLHPPISRGELVLSSIRIYSPGNDFSFYFDVPARRTEVPDGFYADFLGFEIQEAGWVH